MSPDLHLVPSASSVDPAVRPAGARAAERAPLRLVESAATAAASEVHVDVLSPSHPPPEAVRAVERAAEVIAQWRKQGRELHFRADDRSSRIIVEVRDLEGRVLRTIPPSEAITALEEGVL